MSREDKSTRRVVGEAPFKAVSPEPTKEKSTSFVDVIVTILVVSALISMVGLIGWTVLGAL